MGGSEAWGSRTAGCRNRGLLAAGPGSPVEGETERTGEGTSRLLIVDRISGAPAHDFRRETVIIPKVKRTRKDGLPRGWGVGRRRLVHNFASCSLKIHVSCLLSLPVFSPAQHQHPIPAYHSTLSGTLGGLAVLALDVEGGGGAGCPPPSRKPLSRWFPSHHDYRGEGLAWDLAMGEGRARRGGRRGHLSGGGEEGEEKGKQVSLVSPKPRKNTSQGFDILNISAVPFFRAPQRRVMGKGEEERTRGRKRRKVVSSTPEP